MDASLNSYETQKASFHVACALFLWKACKKNESIFCPFSFNKSLLFCSNCYYCRIAIKVWQFSLAFGTSFDCREAVLPSVAPPQLPAAKVAFIEKKELRRSIFERTLNNIGFQSYCITDVASLSYLLLVFMDVACFFCDSIRGMH